MIYLDCRLIKGSGIATYLRNLILCYRNHEPDLMIQYLVSSPSDELSDPPDYQNQHIFGANIYSLSEQLFYPKRIGKDDILHVPHYNAPLLFSGQLIVTVHDLCHYVMKDYFTGLAKRFYASTFMRMILYRASHIITVSNFTKIEIINNFKINPSKISVIHSGIDPHYYPRNSTDVQQYLNLKGLPNNYILYVGNLKPHKNIARMILTYHKAKLLNDNLPKLVICGMKDNGYDFLSEVIQGGISNKFVRSNIIFLGYAQYDDLPYLYSGADLLLFLSLYEGFGLPPLEAMACGTPVIASNTSAVPEILEDTAVLVDPCDLNEIVSAIIELWTTPSLQNEMIIRGLNHVKKFNWEDSAAKHLELYHKYDLNPFDDKVFS